MVVVRRLWATDSCGSAIVGYGPMVRVVSPMTVGFDFGLWVAADSRELWSDGPMVVGGGSDGSMIGNCGPMGMGCGSNGSMVVVLVLLGHGSLIYRSRSSLIYWLRGVSRI